MPRVGLDAEGMFVRINPVIGRRQHSENTANQIMPKKEAALKQVRLTPENHSALLKMKTQAIMPTSLGSLANCAITIALPQLQERFCKPTTTKG